MSTLWLIVGMGAGVYLLRLVGLSLQGGTLPQGVDRALSCVPVALLTGLVVVSLTGQVTVEPSRLLAVGAAVLVAYRTGKMWACILGGMVAYWGTAWVTALLLL